MSSLKDLASLIMVPSLYKDGELHTVKPLADENIIVHPDATDNNDGVDGSTPSTSSNFTFSRGSNLAATRVDVNGLIEKGRENLLLHSNTFSNASWNKVRSSVSSGATDPFGGSNAWSFLTDTTADDQHYIYQVISQSGVGTLSIYAKANGYNWLRMRLPSEEAFFDLANGVTGSSTTGISASMTNAGGGWWRCEVAISDMSSNPNVFIHIAEGDGDIIIGGTPSGTDGLYIYAGQLEQGLVATDYIETGTSAAQSGILEDMPRLDYSGGASCPSLLLEPQRSNINTHSEYIDGWSNKINVTLTANAATSPEGVDNAYKVYPTATGSAYFYDSQNLTNATDYTYSIFVKADGVRYYQLTTSGGATSGNNYANFDLQEGTKVFDSGFNDADIESYGNGWYRIYVVFTASATGVGRIISALIDEPTDGRLGTIAKNGTDGSLVYGSVYESGSYPTSYIPTYGTSQTRSGDGSSLTGVSDILGQTQGTIFIEVGEVHNNFDTGPTKWFMEIRKDQNNSFGFSSGGADFAPTIRFVTNIAGSVSTDAEPAGFSNSKIAIRYTAEDFKIYQNGVLQSTIAKSIGGYVDIQFMEGAGDDLSMPIKQFSAFPTALTDSECIALTTL